MGLHKLFIEPGLPWTLGLTNWKVDLIDVDGTTSMVDLTAQTGISTYPNPFTEGVTVRNSNGTPVRMVLYDPQGKLVHDRIMSGGSFIDLSEHSSGTYRAFFWKDGNRIFSTTMIKQ
ncbi:MAG: T9SS type A sorting domain-containing protein [Flavobacteriales bacterium]|nr:T9SS type A sorting domain-containing protein [Flavobacteriales bacterium]